MWSAHSNASVMGSLDCFGGTVHRILRSYLGISTDASEIVSDSGSFWLQTRIIFGAEIPICGTPCDQRRAQLRGFVVPGEPVKITNGTAHSGYQHRRPGVCVVSRRGLKLSVLPGRSGR